MASLHRKLMYSETFNEEKYKGRETAKYEGIKEDVRNT